MGMINKCTAKGAIPEDAVCNGPYDGHFGIAVLSKLPIVKNEAVPFPGTIVFNRGLMHLSLETSPEPDQAHFDLLCGWWRGDSTPLDIIGLGYFPPDAAAATEAYGSVPTSSVEEAL